MRGFLYVAVLAASVAFGQAQDAAAAPAALVILEFGYLDTSGEPRDQRAEHAARLKEMRQSLGAQLEAKQSFRVVPLPDFPTESCPENTSCLLKEARQAGAELVLTGTIHKISTMASQMWVGMFDAETGERVFYRQMSFRGDTDEAWRRATAYLAREVARSRAAAAAQ
jgi:hypothetical protein